MHYAIPAILARAGLLERFYTDLCGRPGMWPEVLTRLPGISGTEFARRIRSRKPPDVIPSSAIRAAQLFGLRYPIQLRLAKGEPQATFLWAGKEFCRHVLAGGFGQARAVFTFNHAGLEVLQAARKRGLHRVTEQTIAPLAIEREILSREFADFAPWSPSPFAQDSQAIRDLIAREQAEWNEANIILCGSQFVADGIAKVGGPVDRCAVVPYGVDFSADLSAPLPRKDFSNRPLRVLTVGQVGLRKGSPWVVKTAELMKGRAEFRLVGPSPLAADRLRPLLGPAEWTGPVPRSEVKKQFEWADVFYLPSMCEGSATVTYEALACGLPVIATPNAGSVVEDGAQGFIVPIRDPAAAAAAIDRLAADPELYHAMAQAARKRAADFTVARYGERILETLQTRLD